MSANSNNPEPESPVDLEEIKEAVHHWRRVTSQLLFERRRHREAIEHLQLREKMMADNEKLLKQENASLKTALADRAHLIDKLKHLQVEAESLRDGLDDTRAMMQVQLVEHEQKEEAQEREMADLEQRWKWRWEEREKEARETVDRERAAFQEETRKLREEVDSLHRQVDHQEQEKQRELLVAKLERDERIAELEGRWRRQLDQQRARYAAQLEAQKQKMAASVGKSAPVVTSPRKRELPDIEVEIVDDDEDEIPPSPEPPARPKVAGGTTKRRRRKLLPLSPDFQVVL